MKSIKNMLDVLMDGIKDASMILDYAEEAEEEGQSAWHDWFMTHAEKRVDILTEIYDYVSKELDLERKVRENDQIAYALKCHLEQQISHLKHRLNE